MPFRHQRPLMTLLCGIVLLIVLSLTNIFYGSLSLPFSEVAQTLFGQVDSDSPVYFIVWDNRVPMLLTAAAAGAGLSVAGLLLQTLFANPLADPGILGVNSGAGLGVALAMLLFGGAFTFEGLTLSGFALTITAAFLGAGLIIGLLLLLHHYLPGRLMLLIAGVMLGYVAASAIGLLSFYGSAEGVQSYLAWGLGNFSGVTWTRLPYFLVSILLTLLFACTYARPLNALLLGENYARNLGVNVNRVRTIILVITGLLTAMVTALCGPIAFVGLIVPHLTRLLSRTSNHRLLLPACMVWGANLTLLCNWLSVLPSSHGILPINTLTPLLGAPMVFYLLIRRKH